MDIGQEIAALATIQSRLTAALSTPTRPWRQPVSHRGMLLYGPRGIGKTHYLLRHAHENAGFYLSTDQPVVLGRPLFEWMEFLISRGHRALYLDEIHTSPDWAAHLKATYDAHPEVSITVSGSSSLLATTGLADLSRRFVSTRMPYLSFREYLVLRGENDFGVHDAFRDPPEWMHEIAGRLNVLKLFEDYLQHGTRPMFTEGVDSYGIRAIQTSQKTLQADVPALVSPLTMNHFRLMSAVLGYLATSPVPRIQVNSLTREWNVGKEKLYALVHAMEQTGLLRIVRKTRDNAALSIGAKLFLADPSLYRALSGQEGNAREAFVACAVESADKLLHAESDERRGDFIVDGSIRIEVGGRSKERKSADLVVRDGLDVPSPGVLPLWALGFLW
ncbi:MAG: ATP-binding protein [Spirochaetota bacterium]